MHKHQNNRLRAEYFWFKGPLQISQIFFFKDSLESSKSHHIFDCALQEVLSDVVCLLGIKDISTRPKSLVTFPPQRKTAFSSDLTISDVFDGWSNHGTTELLHFCSISKG